MATANLTKRTVDALSFSPSCDYFVWDEKLKGFGVRVTERRNAEGQVHRRKTFLIGYRPRGARQFRRMVLGVFGPLTVEQARTEALRKLSAISSGEDPLEERRAVRKERTVRDLGEEFLTDVDDHRKPTTAYEYRRLWKKHIIPFIGTKKVAVVPAEEVRRLHGALKRTPYVANRVAALLGAFFTYAARQGVRPLHENPARGIKLYRESSRERFLTPEEFARLGEALTRAETEGLPTAPEHRKRPKTEDKGKHRPKSADGGTF